MSQFRTFALVCALLSAAISHAQMQPPQLFSGMEGYTFLPDGTAIPIWGYGWVADGYITLPGPLLEYTEGESVQLNFTNPSPESHTIHLHGLDVDQANDGVPTTSFFVVTGGEATYEFEANHPGTFLYHCHVTTTLHLTMGMYGMILVNRPDMTLFEGGPGYSENAPLLFSDLELETNLNAVQSFPFHDIRPDVFMVNGVSGDQLEQAEHIIDFEPGEPIALRLGSMAYSLLHLNFPEELNAICYMSDGRPVPEPFAVTDLEIFPGERFTVMIEPEAGWDGHIGCEFWNIPDQQLEEEQFVHVRDASLSVPDWGVTAAPVGFPNPTNSEIRWLGPASLSVFDAAGNSVFCGPLNEGRLEVSDWANGFYTAVFPDGTHTRFAVIH
jgi:FtsP/CotA-like multicopper oxidase with cupredoxin domain